MDIQKLQSAIPGAPSPASSRRGGNFAVTISERGVSRSDRAPAPAPQLPQLQVTSDPSLQRVLSAEETQALQQLFAAFRSAPEEGIKPVLYNGRGAGLRLPPAGGHQGQLIDVVG